jgi:hypothetical protein
MAWRAIVRFVTRSKGSCRCGFSRGPDSDDAGDKRPRIFTSSSVACRELPLAMAMPEEYGVRVPPAVAPDTQANRPWNTLSSFLEYIHHQRHRIRLRLKRTKQPSETEVDRVPTEVDQVPTEVDQVPTKVDRVPADNDIIESSTIEPRNNHNNKTGRFAVEDSTVTSGTQNLFDAERISSQSVPATQSAGLTHASREEGQTHLGCLATTNEGGEIVIEQDAPDLNDNVGQETLPKDLIDTRTVGAIVERGGEITLCKSQTCGGPKVLECTNMLESSEGVKEGYIPTVGKKDSDEWCSSAGLFKTVAREIKSVKLFYDTGTPVPWMSQKFAAEEGLTARKIHPKDIIPYHTIRGDFTPEEYVELEIRDDARGVKSFANVSFYLAPDLNGMGLLLGRMFMKSHGIALDAKQKHDMYLAIPGKQSDGKK